ncbi:MAG: C-type lectin domain-containing protein [Synergistaceae bacterium]|nr:C-type lectin domain-containing protein [Synergistaceae bacterium]
MRRLLAVLLVLMVSASAEGFEVPGRVRTDDSSFGLDDGLSVEFCGIVRDPDAEGDIRECVFTLFLVRSREDMTLSVSSGTVYNVLGREFPDYLGASVAGNASVSEIVGGFPTLVWFVHRVPLSHGELPKFSRMPFTFNGQSVELRGKSAEKWSDWKKGAAEKSGELALWAENSPDLSSMYPAKYDAKFLADSQIFKGHHYKAFTSGMTWYEAAAACREMGGHLALINASDREKGKFIQFLYELFFKNKPDDINPTYTFWMGKASKPASQCQCMLFTWNGSKKELLIGIQANTVTDGFICEWDY